MKLYASGERRHQRQRRHDLDRNAAGSDRVAADRIEIRAHGRHATPAAGEADNLTITAQDTYGNTATSYTGSKSLTFSGASASPGRNHTHGLEFLGRRRRLRQCDRDQLQRRCRDVCGQQKRRDEALQGWLDQPQSHRRHPPHSHRPGRDRRADHRHAPSRSPPRRRPRPRAASDNLTITAQDAYENTATTYTGSKSLTFSGASASPGGDQTDRLQQLRHRDRLRHRHRDQLHRRGGDGHLDQKRRDEALRAAAKPSIVVSDGSISTETPLEVTVSPARRIETRARRRHDHPRRGRRRQPHHHRPGHLRQRRHLLHRLPQPHLLRRLGQSRRERPDGLRLRRRRRRLRHRDRRSTSTPGWPAVVGDKNGAMKLYKIGSTSINATDGTLTTATALA